MFIFCPNTFTCCNGVVVDFPPSLYLGYNENVVAH
uniref:Uncharacterized protein n=1 Tax=Anguilla anguilla TaxID=7936 RepID=A0A0E9USH5_ANGAN